MRWFCTLFFCLFVCFSFLAIHLLLLAGSLRRRSHLVTDLSGCTVLAFRWKKTFCNSHGECECEIGGDWLGHTRWMANWYLRLCGNADIRYTLSCSADRCTLHALCTLDAIGSSFQRLRITYGNVHQEHQEVSFPPEQRVHEASRHRMETMAGAHCVLD